MFRVKEWVQEKDEGIALRHQFLEAKRLRRLLSFGDWVYLKINSKTNL